MPRKPKPAVKPMRETPLHIRLTEQEKHLFTAAAERDHMTLSVWARLAMFHAAESKHPLR